MPALHEAVSELRHYSTDSGLPFRCAKLPSLRLCIHTGLEKESALLHFRSALLYTPPVSPLDQINGKVGLMSFAMRSAKVFVGISGGPLGTGVLQFSENIVGRGLSERYTGGEVGMCVFPASCFSSYLRPEMKC